MPSKVYPGRRLARKIKDTGIYFPKFETLKKAKKDRVTWVKALKGSKNPNKVKLAGKLKKCKKHNRCGSGACPICYRLYRKRMILETIKVIPDLHAIMLGTLIFYNEILLKNELQSFSQKDMKRLINRIQQQLKRLSIQTPLIGSFEFVYSPKHQVWIPHLHFIALTSEPEELDPLRPYLLKNSRNQTIAKKPLPLKLEHITEEYASTIGYCYKSSWNRRTRNKNGKKDLVGKRLTDSLLALDRLGMREKLFLFKFKSVKTKSGLKLMEL